MSCSRLVSVLLLWLLLIYGRRYNAKQSIRATVRTYRLIRIFAKYAYMYVYDRLPKRTSAAIADRVVFFSKNATLVSLVCDNGIFKPSDGFSSAWPFMIQSMGCDLRKQNNYVCMYEAGLGCGVNEQATFTCLAQNSPLWSFLTSSAHADKSGL